MSSKGMDREMAEGEEMGNGGGSPMENKADVVGSGKMDAWS